MSGDAVRKLTAASGLTATALIVVGAALLPGDVPGFDATPEQVVRWTLDDRRTLLVASVLVAVGFALLIAFYAGLRSLLSRAEGAPALLSTIGYGAFLVVVAMGLVAVGVLQTQTFVALDGDPATVKVLHEARLIVTNLSDIPTILSAAAIGIVMLRTRFPARWAGWLSISVAVAHALGVIALARTGFFSPTGGSTLVGPVVILVWFVAVSLRLLSVPRHVRV
ncbi:MAG TPA: hypothetical protein VFC99_14535 [Acidimicrobiia bacterium]|nr:hypothetical protein [Acidimicrobiia bacterium]